MKKLLSLLMVLLLMVSVTSCSKDGDDTGNNGGSSQITGHWDGKTTLEIMQEIADKSDTQIMAEVTDGKDFYLNALSLGELEFEEIALFMPMISSQRFEVAVIRTKAGTNMAAFVADLEKRAADAQWVCAAPPDYVKVVANGDCVLYMAITKEFADEEAMVNTFLNKAQ
jgi:hypothetical protein